MALTLHDTHQPPVLTLQRCRKCSDVVSQFKELKSRYPGYWNKPVSASGRKDAGLLIVGLAPGLHGANKTGYPFTGDASGKLLEQMLNEFNLADNVRITNAMKCVPKQNKPTAGQLNNCRSYLLRELTHQLRHKPGSVILALGKVAHDNIVRALLLKPASAVFKHGAVYEIKDNHYLIDSYHCSRYNTQTGRLTLPMFRKVFTTATGLLA